jgi:Ca-activated chloride channel family protein
VLARYTGNGPATISLEGRVGSDQKTLVNETSFPEKTGDDKAFVEQIWARRKVGYLLDQIRQHGESRELVDETKRLAKRYGIATPYTSYLIVPDEPVQRFGRGGMGMQGRSFSGGIAGGGQISGGIGGISGGIGGGLGGLGALGIGGGGKPVQTGSTASLNLLRGPPAATITDFAKQAQPNKGDLAENRDKLNDAFFGQGIGPGAGLGMAGAMGGLGGRGAGKGNGAAGPGALPNMPMLQAAEKRANFIEAKKALGAHNLETVQGGKLGVELSIDSNSLRNQARLSLTALKNVGGRNCLEYAGIWIDEGFDAKTPTIAVKAQSDAYFRLLERQPKLKEVFQLGNALVWITPSGTALVIDPNEGKEKLPDAEIDTLFRQKK